MNTTTASLNEVFATDLDPVIWVVTAQSGTDANGLVVTFVANASLVPDYPRILIGIAKQHNTWGLIKRSGAFAVHLLREENLEWIERFGLRSGRYHDKLVGLRMSKGFSGSPLLEDALTWFDCFTEISLDTGDRTLFLGSVCGSGPRQPGHPLRLQKMIRCLPAEQKTVLESKLAKDIEVDAQAIQEWREGRRTPES
jgi:flavin reductase (DIM6/NTAB) family NADH-FMN oxidoreductase RutF